MARKFLYLIAAIILVIFGFGVAYQLNPGWFGRVAFVPSTQFVEQAAVEGRHASAPRREHRHARITRRPRMKRFRRHRPPGYRPA